MMRGLLLLFVLIMAVCLMQAQKNYNDRLAEQASRIKTQGELDKTQEELSQRESEVEAQSLTLSDMQSALESQAATLAVRESELDEAQTTLVDAQATLTDAQAQLEEQQSLLEQQQTILTQQESELEVRDAALATSQQKLDEQTQLMSEQQVKIDQIIGVKADLIEALNKEFAENQINVNIDAQTGAIVLDSNVLFALRESELTEEGAEILYQVLPVYCEVLLSEKYADYVAEIIIDGYTDSQGDYLSNLQLSQNRALAVAAYLLEISGGFMDENSQQQLEQKLTANGRSESNLILDANGVEDRDASRRVEVKFRLKDDEMIQELSEILSGVQTGETSPGAEAASSETTAETAAPETTAPETASPETAAAETAAAETAAAETAAPENTSAGNSGDVQQITVPAEGSDVVVLTDTGEAAATG